MTPQQAAKECMARVFFRLESGECTGEFIPMRTVAEMEHEFTEIISQVTHPALTGVNFSARLQANLASDKPQAVAEFRDLILGQETAGAFGFNDPANLAALNQLMFPQEIVEPQPKPWWRTLWAYALNREPR